MGVIYRGSIVTQWKRLYPNQEFPNPKDHPQLYGDDFAMKTSNVTYEMGWWEQLTGDCCSYSRCCSKGLLDYECQFNNSCYLNIAELAIHMIGFFMALLAITTALGYALRALYKFAKSVVFIHKFVEFVAGCMKCLTFGVFDQKVYYKKPKSKKAQLTPTERLIQENMEDLDVKVLAYRLDAHQRQRILQVFEDYEIQEHQFCH